MLARQGRRWPVAHSRYDQNVPERICYLLQSDLAVPVSWRTPLQRRRLCWIRVPADVLQISRCHYHLQSLPGQCLTRGFVHRPSRADQGKEVNLNVAALPPLTAVRSPTMIQLRIDLSEADSALSAPVQIACAVCQVGLLQQRPTQLRHICNKASASDSGYQKQATQFQLWAGQELRASHLVGLPCTLRTLASLSLRHRRKGKHLLPLATPAPAQNRHAKAKGTNIVQRQQYMPSSKHGSCPEAAALKSALYFQISCTCTLEVYKYSEVAAVGNARR